MAKKKKAAPPATKKYQVLVRQTSYGCATVMAASKEEAGDIACDAALGLSDQDVEWEWELEPEFDVDEVTEVGE